MAFENNQQDAFNLRNDTERMKQFEAELNKATTSIGAAEVAAEKELAELKLKNLATQQEARIKKLDELIEKEEAGIRKLAALRRELSDKQFEAHKKEIQKELQLLEDAIDELREAETKKVKKSEDSATKQTSNTKDITSTSKSKPAVPTEKSAVKDSGKATDPELIKLVGSIDKTLGSLRDTVLKQNQPKEKDLVPDIKSRQTTTVAAKGLQEVKAVTKSAGAEIVASKVGDIPQPSPDVIEKTAVKDPENKPQPELINLVSSIDKTLGSLLATVANRSKEKSTSATDDTQPSITDNIKGAMQQSQTETPTNGDGKPPKNSGGKPPKNSGDESVTPPQKEFSNDAQLLDSVDLGHFSAEKVFSVFEAYRESIDAGVQSVLEQATAFKTDEKGNKAFTSSQSTIDFAGDFLVSFKKAEAAEEKLRDLRADADADEATKKAVELNKQILFETELQKLKESHATKEQSLRLAAIANEAKADDLKNNSEAYELEARIARENAFAAEQNRLTEERIKAETEIAWNADHRRALLDQEEQNERLKYLAEYQQLQTDGFNHLTENMSRAEFEALREREDKIEKTAAAQHKAAMASEKALDTLRRKDLTNKQKKELLQAQVQKRVAEKDWSSFERKEGESDEDFQKRKENTVKAEMAVNAAMGALANLAQKLNDQTDKIGEKQAPIDTRLQGSTANDKILGSYWKQLARDMNKIGAVNPYFKQEDFANNIETLVNKGISFDVKQRAFLMTIQEKIANTFDAADGTLLRLIRIQQQDTTAGRLGMESALNSFLNSMYETSEYLTDVASSVRNSLEEMQALMEGAAGTELEFQIQKWMGSLYSVGMSQDAVQGIAQAFGQIASGDVSGLTGSGSGNLLIMAANEAGMSIADILQEGLDAKETNELMQAMVNYLAEIAETSSDSRVVQQQLANVYGLKASDLKAATNLASSIKDVSKQDLTYSGMLGQLNKMANSMALRTSTGEMLSNVWSNVQYTMATQMANDPILYLLPRVATLLEDYAGGIDLPFLNVMGFGIDLNTSVAQLMNVAAMSGSILGALGPMISGLASATSGSVMLSLAGINAAGKAPVIARGAPATLQNVSGSSISESGYIGNSSGEDVKNATLQDAADSKKKQMVEAKEEESSDDVVMKSQLAVISIYNLLEEVAHGSQSLRVRVINHNGFGSAGGSSGGAAGGGSSPIGDGSGSGSTGGMGSSSLVNGATGGADNGNWVLSF